MEVFSFFANFFCCVIEESSELEKNSATQVSTVVELIQAGTQKLFRGLLYSVFSKPPNGRHFKVHFFLNSHKYSSIELILA